MANTAVTIARSKVSPLSIDETAATGFTHKFRVLYSDVAYGTGSEDTVTMTLGTTPTGWYCDRALVNVSTAFAGTTSLTLAVGTTTTTTAFISAQSVLTAGILEPADALEILTSATATTSLGLRAVFTSATDGSPSALTAGQLDIYLHMVATNKDLP